MATKKTTAEDTPTAAQPEPTPKRLTLQGKILAVKNEIGKVTKDGEGKVGSEQKGNQKTIKYATLSNVLEKVTPALHKYGVDYVVAPVWSELAVQMMVQGFRFFSIHFVDAESGDTTEPIIYPFRIATNPDPIKADGSTITYVTRYLLGLALGIQTEEDPDVKEQRPLRNQQQPPKVRTFRECVNGFYATYNKGNLEGAKKTLDFIRRNWGKYEECAAEIAQMELADLTVWKKIEQPTEPKAADTQGAEPSATAQTDTKSE